MPLPDVREANSDTAWDAWAVLSAQEDLVFADTAPASMPMPLPQGDRRYATTVPAALTSRPLPRTTRLTPAGNGIALGDVMAQARRNNRLCPRPLAWQRLYEMLPYKTQGPHGWQPPPPLTGSAWSTTPPLAKRMCLRDHIEWAEAHGCLDGVHAFLESLSEEEWHHMGE
jgi:hypothetical protein